MSSKRNDQVNEDGSAGANRREFLASGVGMAAAATLLSGGVSGAHAEEAGQTAGKSPSPGGAQDAKPTTNAEQEVLALSRDKWRWMSERKVDSLDNLFHEKAVFVHMGATMTRKQELDTIRGGGIQYKTIDIQKASVEIIDSTAILLNTIRLVAVVGGNEVTNPFVVTEVYVQQSGAWKLASLSFTRTLR